MSHPVRETTVVVIIGAGVAGLTTANMLRRAGIDCVVLERQSRVHVEERQRAGNLEARAVRRYEDWGLAERVVGGVPYEGILELRVHGVGKLIREERDEDTPGRMCPQQVLVRNLIKVFLDDGGDLRFGAADVDLADVTSEEPSVRYRDAAGTVQGCSLLGVQHDSDSLGHTVRAMLWLIVDPSTLADVGAARGGRAVATRSRVSCGWCGYAKVLR
jgi:p-hydroxybenzoate 3-monooxygenase